MPSLCENAEQDVSKNDVIDSMDNHDDGLFANQLDQLNQLVNTNEIVVCSTYFEKLIAFIFDSCACVCYRNEEKWNTVIGNNLLKQLHQHNLKNKGAILWIQGLVLNVDVSIAVCPIYGNTLN